MFFKALVVHDESHLIDDEKGRMRERRIGRNATIGG